MPTVYTDSSVLIAAANADDLLHQEARDIVEGIDGGALPSARISNYVVAEVLNYLHGRRDHQLAVDFYDRLAASAGFAIEETTNRGDREAIETFRRRPRLSFVDASIVSTMLRADIEFIYSFDDDFDGIDGLTRLNVAENPFA